MHSITPGQLPNWVRRVLWLAAIWAMSVVALGAAAACLRLVMTFGRPNRLTMACSCGPSSEGASRLRRVSPLISETIRVSGAFMPARAIGVKLAG